MDRREFLTGAAMAALWPFAETAQGGGESARTRGAEIARARAAKATLALATADTEAHVVAVSLHSARVVARVKTLEGPRSIERGPGTSAIVAHTSQGAVTLLEGSPPRVRRVLRGFGEPRYTAVAGAHAYISDSGHGEIALVDLERGRVVRRAPAGEHARHITLHGDTIWVSLGSAAPAITVLDTDLRIVRHVRPPFLAHDVAFSPGGRRVWVTGGRENRIAIYRPHGHDPDRVIAADEAPQHVGFAGTHAYVTSGDSGTLRTHSIDGGLRRSTPIARGSYNVQPGADRVLTPSLMHGTLTILDAQGRVKAAPQVAKAAHDACVV
jgi:hypothetical protein